MVIFGVAVGMRADGMGQMIDCTFTIGGAFCQMGIFEHLFRFQQAFTGVLVKIILSILFFSATWLLYEGKVLFPLKDNRLIYFKKMRELENIFDNFLSILSDGIIQARIYA